ncbi:MAG: hypothetical protein JWN40_296 [Phycisphaerales bacterium]|nr:hypothetical protein [Phycisphaerales bacterium]
MRISKAFAVIVLLPTLLVSAEPPARKTAVSIDGASFLINGQPTYRGRSFNGVKVEGLLLNARLVQGIFDDLNPETRKLWAYPDGAGFDAERNTREFVAAMAEWRRRGLVSFTINLEGGSPQGYSKEQPWHNSAFTEAGALRPAYMGRLEKILDRADELGMAPILGFFYFGQVARLKDEAAVIKGVENATDWLLAKGYTNVLIEIANECNQANYAEIIKPKRAGELIELVQKRSRGKLLVSTSLTGGQIPNEVIARRADFLLLHGNGQRVERIAEMVKRTRAVAGYRGQPILFNEDDHFDFEKPENNFLAAIGAGVGWGYFDYRMKGEGFAEGYQSVPVDWGIGSGRKRGFFELLARVTGSGE